MYPAAPGARAARRCPTVRCPSGVLSATRRRWRWCSTRAKIWGRDRLLRTPRALSARQPATGSALLRAAIDSISSARERACGARAGGRVGNLAARSENREQTSPRLATDEHELGRPTPTAAIAPCARAIRGLTIPCSSSPSPRPASTVGRSAQPVCRSASAVASSSTLPGPSAGFSRLLALPAWSWLPDARPSIQCPGCCVSGCARSARATSTSIRWTSLRPGWA